jgi:hypothetical protein
MPLPDERALLAEAVRQASALSGVPEAAGKAFLAALRQCLEECRKRRLREARGQRGAAQERVRLAKLETAGHPGQR